MFFKSRTLRLKQKEVKENILESDKIAAHILKHSLMGYRLYMLEAKMVHDYAYPKKDRIYVFMIFERIK